MDFLQNMEYNMKDNVQRMKNNKYYIQSLGGKKMSNIDMMSANAIRVLAADAVQKANSGHPGLPLGSAAMAYELWAKHMNHNPKNPKWENRDRFILSGGHGSTLLYSLLHLFGYGDLSIDDMKNFRQWGS